MSYNEGKGEIVGGSGSLTDKVAFEQRWEGREGMSHMGVAPDQGNRKCKSYEERLEFWENR